MCLLCDGHIHCATSMTPRSYNSRSFAPDEYCYVTQRMSSTQESDSLIISGQELARETDTHALSRERRGTGSSSLVYRVNRNWNDDMIRCPDAIMGRDGDIFRPNGGEEVSKWEQRCVLIVTVG